MTRDHFKQVYSSPYFQSDYYKNETEAGKCENKIIKVLKKILNVLFNRS